jgi:glycine/D-amino acid oxidase-like deaminating enzyme
MASTWVETVEKKKHYASLAGDIHADVCIVGAGLTGASSAYLLAKEGRNVVLLESSKDATESASAHTTGFITQDIDTSLSELCQMFGPEKAVKIWRSLGFAMDQIEKTIQEEDIACEFIRCSYFTYARNDSEWEDLESENKLANHFGFPSEARRDGKLGFSNAGYQELKNQAKFHALQYLEGLFRAAEDAGARIFFDSKAETVETRDATRVVKTKNGSVTADAVILSTYYPFTDPSLLFAHTGRYITYIIEAAIRSGALPEALYQDENNPYHYFRVDKQDGYDRLIFGGEDHRREVKMDEEKNFLALEEYMRDRLHDITLDIKRRWRWAVVEPMDGLPFIGPLKNDPQQYVATGFSGTGMTISRLASHILADAIGGRRNEYADLYAVDRIPSAYQLAKKTKDYVGEFFGGAAKNIFK